MQTLKPYLMLACVAFAVGFAGYLAMARLSASVAPADGDIVIEAPVSDQPTPDDDLGDLRAA